MWTDMHACWQMYSISMPFSEHWSRYLILDYVQHKHTSKLYSATHFSMESPHLFKSIDMCDLVYKKRQEHAVWVDWCLVVKSCPLTHQRSSADPLHRKKWSFYRRQRMFRRRRIIITTCKAYVMIRLQTTANVFHMDVDGRRMERLSLHVTVWWYGLWTVGSGHWCLFFPGIKGLWHAAVKSLWGLMQS